MNLEKSKTTDIEELKEKLEEKMRKKATDLEEKTTLEDFIDTLEDIVVSSIRKTIGWIPLHCSYVLEDIPEDNEILTFTSTDHDIKVSVSDETRINVIECKHQEIHIEVELTTKEKYIYIESPITYREEVINPQVVDIKIRNIVIPESQD